MKIENTEVYGFCRALTGMRNPIESWDKGDTSYFLHKDTICAWDKSVKVEEVPFIGPNDMKLACKLIKGGSEYRKFLRQIVIWVDFTLPRYIWTELDTYKISTVRDSCSTMHKLGHRDLEVSDFAKGTTSFLVTNILPYINELGRRYRETRDYQYIRDIKKILPESFLQKSTFMMNYETALNMFHQRKNHRLPEWNVKTDGSICRWILSLPYMKNWTELVKKANH